MSPTSFAELGLPSTLLKAVSDLGFESPSDIQGAAIPPALEGRDLVGLSETGSGKTAAFALPALARIDLGERRPQVLILCPTRELANQVCEEVHRLGKHLDGLRSVPVYGGAPMDRQLRALKNGPHVIVGTPGRLLDHLRRGSFDPGGISLAVLDEADRMLDMGFREEMEDLLGQLPGERQTLFFSATMNKGVSRLIERFGDSPETVEIERETLTVDSIDQVSYEVRQRSRLEVLSRILDIEEPKLSIVFCNTKRAVDEVTEALLARGYQADRLHGDISQMHRERTLRRFREGALEILVATDVAARGIDVDDVDIVFNYDLPQDPEDYVHRIGRTGRAGKSGRAVSFLFGRDAWRLQSIERYIKQKVPRAPIPSLKEVQGHIADQVFETLKERLERKDFADYSHQVDQLVDSGHEVREVAAGLLSIFHESLAREGEEIQEDRPKPKRGEKRERPERGERDSRDPRDRREPRRRDDAESTGEMKTLFLNLGRNNNLAAGAIAGMLYNEANLPQGAIGRIRLFPKHSLIEIKAEHAPAAIKAGKDAVLFGKPFKLDYHRERPRGDDDRPYKKSYGKKPYDKKKGGGKKRY